MKRHLIIGASGQVGWHLYRYLVNRQELVWGTYRSFPLQDLLPLDISDPIQAEQTMKLIQPTMVYLPVGITNVDYCETHPTETYQTNVINLLDIASLAKKYLSKVIFFSSDYVFNGQVGPYQEDDPADPICEYGRQKSKLEKELQRLMPDVLIIRTTVVFSWEPQAKNFVCRLIARLERGEPLKVPVDQVGNPTYAPNLTESVVELVEKDARGIFHVVGPDLISRYDFACETARVFSLNASLIQPVLTIELEQIARRPLLAGLLCQKAEKFIQCQLIGGREGLQRMYLEKYGCR
jgi:dTDP-4-dehydrorhamnose reductase